SCPLKLVTGLPAGAGRRPARNQVRGGAGWAGYRVGRATERNRGPGTRDLAGEPASQRDRGTGAPGVSPGTGPAQATGPRGTTGGPGGPRSPQGSDRPGVVPHPGDGLGDLTQGPLPAARLVPGSRPGRGVPEHVPPAQPPQPRARLVEVGLGEPGPVGVQRD